jgi:hypothetical protein
MPIVPEHLDVVTIDPDDLAGATHLPDLLRQFTYVHSAPQHVGYLLGSKYTERRPAVFSHQFSVISHPFED